MRSTSSGPTAPSCTASTSAPRATSRTPSWPPQGLPSAAELELLEPFRDQLPEEVFTTVYQAPSTDGEGGIRQNLRTALRLLREAGWTVENGRLVNARGRAVPLRDPAERAVVRAPYPAVRQEPGAPRHRGDAAHRRSGAIPEPDGRLRFRHDGRELRPEPVAGQRAARVLEQRGGRHPRQPQHHRHQGPGGRPADRPDHRGADPRGPGDGDPRARSRAAVGPLRDPALAQPDLPGRLLGQVRPAGEQPALRPAGVQLVGRSGQGGGRRAAQGRAREAPRPRRWSERRPCWPTSSAGCC